MSDSGWMKDELRTPPAAPINDGGPAFPWYQTPGNQDNLGMSLRDWFAGQALENLGLSLVPPGITYENTLTREGQLHAISRDAYALADAMLKARGQ